MTGPMLATSRYTFRLPLASGYALFNTSSGSVLRLEGLDAESSPASSAANALCSRRTPWAMSSRRGCGATGSSWTLTSTSSP
jgi:hypothetical protein